MMNVQGIINEIIFKRVSLNEELAKLHQFSDLKRILINASIMIKGEQIIFVHAISSIIKEIEVEENVR